MKNPLTIFSQVFRTPMEAIPLIEAVTLEFCYDHINEDYPAFNPDELLLLQYDAFQSRGIQESE